MFVCSAHRYMAGSVFADSFDDSVSVVISVRLYVSTECLDRRDSYTL